MNERGRRESVTRLSSGRSEIRASQPAGGHVAWPVAHALAALAGQLQRYERNGEEWQRVRV